MMAERRQRYGQRNRKGREKERERDRQEAEEVIFRGKGKTHRRISGQGDGIPSSVPPENLHYKPGGSSRLRDLHLSFWWLVYMTTSNISSAAQVDKFHPTRLPKAPL